MRVCCPHICMPVEKASQSVHMSVRQNNRSQAHAFRRRIAASLPLPPPQSLKYERRVMELESGGAVGSAGDAQQLPPPPPPPPPAACCCCRRRRVCALREDEQLGCSYNWKKGANIAGCCPPTLSPLHFSPGATAVLRPGGSMLDYIPRAEHLRLLEMRLAAKDADIQTELNSRVAQVDWWARGGEHANAEPAGACPWHTTHRPQ